MISFKFSVTRVSFWTISRRASFNVAVPSKVSSCGLRYTCWGYDAAALAVLISVGFTGWATIDVYVCYSGCNMTGSIASSAWTLGVPTAVCLSLIVYLGRSICFCSSLSFADTGYCYYYSYYWTLVVDSEADFELRYFGGILPVLITYSSSSLVRSFGLIARPCSTIAVELWGMGWGGKLCCYSSFLVSSYDDWCWSYCEYWLSVCFKDGAVGGGGIKR